VEIGTRVGELELADPRFVPFFQAVAELRALVFVHPVDRTLDPRLAALGLGFGLACRPRPRRGRRSAGQ